jgi:hypothetical protein
MTLTSADQSWIQGFISFFKGSPQPTSGARRAGWDAASKLSEAGVGWGK